MRAEDRAGATDPGAARPPDLGGLDGAEGVLAGRTPDGLPVGLQLVGRHLADGTVLRVAAAYETARPWSHRRPTLAPAGVSAGL
ncbi:hypothetical protein ACGFZL_12650 [Streptomyces sp. NPDC048182]|uniref:hypothetical protein n=1 Tax=Streptomyces sp. NPDC048182 TaxID=3365507 RepID=UPI0037137DC1